MPTLADIKDKLKGVSKLVVSLELASWSCSNLLFLSFWVILNDTQYKNKDKTAEQMLDVIGNFPYLRVSKPAGRKSLSFTLSLTHTHTHLQL